MIVTAEDLSAKRISLRRETWNKTAEIVGRRPFCKKNQLEAVNITQALKATPRRPFCKKNQLEAGLILKAVNSPDKKTVLQKESA